ncbi:MAG: carcinine hydrolase/isopenicillin-N N-acyltransferase family protein [Candidatus Moranbacteria bacterium]|nr:carcinine hydrolase/isopenicillin-N N-acyltransferase family protein [Candidatus Moranbacteria bacterium]
MCTTAAKNVNNGWFLLKTRDPVPWMRWDDEIKLFDSKDDKYKKLIIQNPNPNEDGYYGGINEKGVAFVATFVKVADDQVSYILRPYVRLLLDAATAKEAVEIIKAFNPRIGGNMFVADPNECYGVEGVPEKYFVEKISEPAVKTNHLTNLPNENLNFQVDPGLEQWSRDRFERAKELIKGADSLEDFQDLLRDRKNAEKKTAICLTKKEVECFTHSAFIFDTKSRKAIYCQGNPLENEFKEYGFKKD